MILQAPDPTAEYKEPAKVAFEKLRAEWCKLTDLMRGELAGGQVGSAHPSKRPARFGWFRGLKRNVALTT